MGVVKLPRRKSGRVRHRFWPETVPNPLFSVRRVEAFFRLAHAIEKRVAAAMARADKLTQAILAKANR